MNESEKLHLNKLTNKIPMETLQILSNHCNQTTSLVNNNKA